MLAVRNFTSAATGLAIAIALFRGLTRRSAEDHRQLLGRPDPRRPVHPAADLDRRRARPRLAGRAPDLGAVADRDDAPGRHSRPSPSVRSRRRSGIKELGNNGGGFFNANSSHPFENPTPLTNWLEIFALLIVLVLADLHVRPVREGPAPGLGDLRRDGDRSCSSAPSSRCTSSSSATRCSRPASTRPARQHGGQGDAVRGRASAACSWPPRPAPAPARSTPGTTAPSRSPGSSRSSTWSSARSRPAASAPGMYGMLVIGAILAVFIAGLMVGRTPEYLGKKVEAFEIKMAMLVALVLGASILGFTAIASVLARGDGRPAQPGSARLQRDPVRLLAARRATTARPSPA